MVLLIYKHSKANNYVSIIEKPKLVPLSKTIELLPMTTHIIVCNAFTGSKPVFFEWTKNGDKLVQSAKIKVEVIDAISMLTLKNLSKDDSALFTCSAKNALGTDSTSTQLIVKGCRTTVVLNGTMLDLSSLNIALTRGAIISFEFVHLDFILFSCPIYG